MKVVRLASVLLLIGSHVVLGQGISHKMGIGFGVNAQKLYGDTRSGSFVFGGNPLNIRYQFNPHFYIDSDVGYSQLSTDFNNSSFDTDLIHFGFKTGYRFRAESKLNPLLYVGVGLLNFKFQDGPVFWDGYGALGGGVEYHINEKVGVNLTGDFRYSTGDDFDGGSIATGRDGFFKVAFGINYYLRSSGTFLSEPALFTEIPQQEAPFEQSDPEVETASVGATTEENGVSHDVLLDKKQLLTEQLKSKDEEAALLLAKNDVMDERLRLLREMTNGAQGNSANGRSTNGVSSQFRNSLSAYADDQFERAIESLRDLLTKYPEHEESSNWWYWLGESYFASGDFDASEWAFQQSFEEGISRSKAETARLMLGLSKWKSGKLTEAYTELREFLRHEPHPRYETLAQAYLAEIEISPEFQPE